MPDLQEKKLLALDTLKSLQECIARGQLVAKLEVENHKLSSWNENLRKGLRARVASKKEEKGLIAQAITTNYSSSPSGLDPSMHLTDVLNILKTLSSNLE